MNAQQGRVERLEDTNRCFQGRIGTEQCRMSVSGVHDGTNRRRIASAQPALRTAPFDQCRPQGQRDMERLAALLAGQRCGGYETCHVAADGTAIQLAVHAKVWRDAGDRIVGARGTLTPVSAAVSG